MICYLIFSVLDRRPRPSPARRTAAALGRRPSTLVQTRRGPLASSPEGFTARPRPQFFAFDARGHALLPACSCVVSAFVFVHSEAYLHDDATCASTVSTSRLLMLLTTAIAGAYFARNLAVTWIFLEATTLCSAGIVYHRRTAQALGSGVEIRLRLLDGHRHGLPGHPAAGRRRPTASRSTTPAVAAAAPARQPALPEDGLSADPLRLQLQGRSCSRSTPSASTPTSPPRPRPRR